MTRALLSLNDLNIKLWRINCSMKWAEATSNDNSIDQPCTSVLSLWATYCSTYFTVYTGFLQYGPVCVSLRSGVWGHSHLLKLNLNPLSNHFSFGFSNPDDRSPRSGTHCRSDFLLSMTRPVKLLMNLKFELYTAGNEEVGLDTFTVTASTVTSISKD